VLTQADIAQLAPDPLEPTSEEVERYVRALQEQGHELARREVWNQIRLAGARAGRRRAEAHDTLNKIFRLGAAPSEPLDGSYDGILVTTTTLRTIDPLFRGLAAAWMPWVGKRFDAGAQTGDNLLLPSARVPAGLFWPRYRMEDEGDGRRVAFRFRTYTSAGAVDPDRRTLKIDYDSDTNPRLLIRDILDELVEVVPGAYLGKVLLRRGRDRHWALAGYFALEPAR
jgi:hypothetical protein